MRTITAGHGRAGLAGIAAISSLVLLASCSSGHHRAASGASGSPTAGTSGTVASSTPAGPSGGSGTAKPTPTPSSFGGVEGATGTPGEKCPVTSSASVAAAFAAKVAHETVTTSGIGSPLCMFTLAPTRGAAFGGLSASVIAKYPAAAFAQSRKSSPGAQLVTGLGTSAFYVPKSTTLKVLDGASAITLQYTGYLAAGSQPSPAKIRSVLIALATSYVAQN
ncbi:MAG: hypothetical protein ACR2N4_04965 [Jatrophihabitans sp.]